MSKQYPGGLITKTPVTPSGPYETSTASGVWTINQAAYWAKQGLWPTSGNILPDSYFNYVTMLLHGDGTNGAQNNTFLDSSTNNFTITRNGNTTQGTFTPYGSNWSCYLDGSGDQLTTPSQASFRIDQGNWTWEGWVFPTSLRDTNVLISLGTGGSAVWYTVSVGLTNGAIQMGTNNGSWNFIGIYASSANVIKANQWNHFAIVYSGTTLYFFANGVAVGSQASPYLAPGQSGTLYMGSYYNNYNNDGSWYGGYVSNLRFVKGTAVYSGSTYTVPTAPLTAITNTSLLAFQSNRFIDTSANAYTLTRVGDTSVQRFSPFSPTTAYSTSVIGGSGYFDGSGDSLKVTYGSQMNLTNQDFAIEFWLYIPSALSNRSIVCQDQSNYQLNAYVDTSNNLTFYSYQAAGTQNFAVAMGAVPVGAWSHFVIARTGSTVAGFRNGTRIATATFSGSVDAQTGGWYLGAVYSNLNQINGYLSDVRFVIGSNPYGVSTTLTVPTSPLTAVTNTQFLASFTNAGILDNAMMNDLETVGNAQISTSVKKYGTGSMYFDGTGDGLKAVGTPNTAFGTGDFTVEFWINLAANLGNYVKIIEMGLTGACFTIETQTTLNTLTVTDLNTTVFLTSSSALTTGTWIHVAVTRASGTLRIFQNGTQTGSVANSTNFANSGSVYIGQSNSGQAMNGYIDDLRITKGVARYTANFTPPTSAFPNQ